MVDLPAPPLPDATAMMASTPGTPTVPWARCAAAAAAGEVAPGAEAARPRVPPSALPSHGGDARQRLNRRLGTPADRFPCIHHGSIHRDREENLAVRHHDVRQGAGLGHSKPVCTLNSFEACQKLARRLLLDAILTGSCQFQPA